MRGGMIGWKRPRECSDLFRDYVYSSYLCSKVTPLSRRFVLRRLEDRLFKLYWSAHDRAEKVGMTFDLPTTCLQDMWVEQGGSCSISSARMTFGSYREPTQVSLDRIDSRKGYTEDNVQLVCLIVNLGKNNLENSEVIEFFEGIWNRAHRAGAAAQTATV